MGPGDYCHFCHNCVIGVYDKNNSPKIAFTMPQGAFLRHESIFVIFVILSRGSSFNMEYISIRRMTSPATPPMSMTKMTQFAQSAKPAFLVRRRAISPVYSVIQSHDTIMTEMTEVTRATILESSKPSRGSRESWWKELDDAGMSPKTPIARRHRFDSVPCLPISAATKTPVCASMGVRNSGKIDFSVLDDF